MKRSAFHPATDLTGNPLKISILTHVRHTHQRHESEDLPFV
jgi:hypothetical protein